MKRKKFAVTDRFGCVRYFLEGVSIRAKEGMVELIDIDPKLRPGLNTYVKAVLDLGGDNSALVEVEYKAESETESDYY